MKNVAQAIDVFMSFQQVNAGKKNYQKLPSLS
jgi:hypothetical protein